MSMASLAGVLIAATGVALASRRATSRRLVLQYCWPRSQCEQIAIWVSCPAFASQFGPTQIARYGS